MIHTFTCSKDTKAPTYISRALVVNGIALLRFDLTGLGGSEGEFANTNFSSNVEDLVAAADYLRRHYEWPRLLIGHSLGGAAVLTAAGHFPEVLAVATIGAPFEPAHVTKQFAPAFATIAADGEAAVQLAGRTFTIRKQFLEDLDEQRQVDRIAGLRRALLVFHSPIDDVVNIDNARHIYEVAKHPKSFITLDDADHMLSRAEDGLYVGHMLAASTMKFIHTNDTNELSGDFPRFIEENRNEIP